MTREEIAEWLRRLGAVHHMHTGGELVEDYMPIEQFEALLPLLRE